MNPHEELISMADLRARFARNQGYQSLLAVYVGDHLDRRLGYTARQANEAAGLDHRSARQNKFSNWGLIARVPGTRPAVHRLTERGLALWVNEPKEWGENER